LSLHTPLYLEINLKLGHITLELNGAAPFAASEQGSFFALRF